MLISGFLVTLYNSLQKLREPIKSLDATLDSSLRRKLSLSDDLRSVAETTAGFESGSFRSIQSEITRAAEVISKGSSPTIILAELAVRFPELRSIGAFERVQSTEVALEDKIGTEISLRNQTAETYNTAIGLFPAVVFARMLGFSIERYRKDGFDAGRSEGSGHTASGSSNLDDRLNRLLNRK